MKYKSEFNLEHSIKEWKDSLFSSHIMTTDNVQELESHLLDKIDDLKSKGLNDEEAFLIAIEGMGTNGVIVSEFSKVNFLNTIIVKCMPILQCVLFYLLDKLTINFIGLKKEV